MNREGVEAFLSAIGVGNAINEGEWVQASCPLAFARHQHGHDSNPSFGVIVKDDGKSGYHCFACGIRGRDLGDLLIELQHYSRMYGYAPKIDFKAAWEIVKQEDDIGYLPHDWTEGGEIKHFEPWPEWYLESFKPAWARPEAREYLLGRGMCEVNCTALDLRYDAKKQMVCFPIRHRSGHLSGLRGRSISGKRYHDYVWNGNNNTALVLYGEHWLDPMKPVVVVEGPFDLAAVRPVYRNVCAIFSASINQRKLGMLSCAVQVLAMTDSDLAGEQVYWRLKEALPTTQRIEIPEGHKDPGELTSDEVRAALATHLKLD